MAFLIINSPNKNAFTPYPNAPLEHMVDSPWIIVNWTQFGLGEWHGVDYIQWRRQWHPTPVLLPGESMDGGAWWLPSMGSHRVGHDWSDLAAAAAAAAADYIQALRSRILLDPSFKNCKTLQKLLASLWEEKNNAFFPW